MSVPYSEFECETLSDQEFEVEDIRCIRPWYVCCIRFERDGMIGSFGSKEEGCEPEGGEHWAGGDK